MGDIIARIVLQATGGSQAASEIRKVGEAAKQTRKDTEAGVNYGGGGAGGGAFERTPSGLYAPAGMAQLRQEHQEFLSSSRPAPIETSPNAPSTLIRRSSGGGRGRAADRSENNGFGFIRGAATGVEDIGSGNLTGGVGTGIAGMSRMLGGTAGAAALALGLGVYATNKLANTWEEQKALMMSGTAQALGMNVEGVQSANKALNKAGMQGYFNSTQAGLAMNGGTALSNNALTRATEQMYKTGLSPEASTRFIGLSQQNRTFSEKGNALFGENGGILGNLMGTFGKSNSSQFVNNISDIIQKAMAIGIKNGSEYLKAGAFATSLANLGTYGGASIQSATAITNKSLTMTQRLNSGVNSGMDAYLFMQNRVKGESYGDTLRRVTNLGPDAVTENLRIRAGGNDTKWDNLLISAGYSAEESARIRETYAGSSAQAAFRAQVAARPKAPAGFKPKYVPLTGGRITDDLYLAMKKAQGIESNIALEAGKDTAELKTGIFGTKSGLTDYQQSILDQYKIGSQDDLPANLKYYNYIYSDSGYRNNNVGKMQAQLNMYNKMTYKGAKFKDPNVSTILSDQSPGFEELNRMFSDPSLKMPLSRIYPDNLSRGIDAQVSKDKVSGATAKEFVNALIQALKEIPNPPNLSSDYSPIQ